MGHTSQNSEKKLKNDNESLNVYTSLKNENLPKNAKKQQPKER